MNSHYNEPSRGYANPSFALRCMLIATLRMQATSIRFVLKHLGFHPDFQTVIYYNKYEIIVSLLLFI